MRRHVTHHRLSAAALAAAIGVLAALLYAPRAGAGPDGTWKSGTEAYDKVCSRCHLAGVGPELRGRKLPAAYVKIIARNGFRAMPAMPESAIDEATLGQIAAMIEASTLPKGAAATTTPRSQR